jgi:trimeric autotransporter adhesin
MKQLIVLSGLVFCVLALTARAQSTGFTYQGSLTDGGTPANGFYDLRFELFEAATNGVALDDPYTQLEVPVSNGVFTVLLDFGLPLFNGSDRWLEVSVRTNGSANPYTTLAPRQRITPTPYALHAFNAANLMTFVNEPLDIKVNGQRVLRLETTVSDSFIVAAPNLIGGSSNNAVASGVRGGTIAGGGAGEYDGSLNHNRVGGDFGTVGGGLGNLSSGFASVVGGGHHNSSSGYGATVAGGRDNRASGSDSAVGGGQSHHASGDGATIGGGIANTSSGPVATVGGGQANISSGEAATVGGGALNTSASDFATISGGRSNIVNLDSSFSTIGGGESHSIGPEAWNSTIGGGEINRIDEGADNGTIAGGGYNLIGFSADYASIGGGILNTNSAESGTIAGGQQNLLEEFAPHSVIGGGFLNSIFGATATIGGGGFNRIRESGATIAGGFQNLVGEDATYSAIGGGFRNSIIDAERATVAGGELNLVQQSAYAAIGGGIANEIHTAALGSVIGGGDENIISTNSLSSTISGGSGNEIHQNAVGSFIGGGAQSTVAAGATYGTIGGGWVNRIEPGVRAGTVAGGEQNRVHTNGTFATVGGGGYNVASGFGSVVAGGGGLHFEDGNENRGNTAAGRWSGVLGGADNVAGALFTIVGGGEFNRAEGGYAVVPGGLDNRATGVLSFAAGWGAQALHNGAWVWGDNSPTGGEPPLASTTNNQFIARAAGGVRFFTDKGATTGAELAPGSGSWSMLSDRNAKENFVAANPRDVLNKLVALPLGTWNYKAQDSSIRHIGPVAQDFHAAFGVGEDERRISSVDADGVALAAIQGLNQKVEEENRALRLELKGKEAQIEDLRKALGALRDLVERSLASEP